jgi:hypothetical protein
MTLPADVQTQREPGGRQRNLSRLIPIAAWSLSAIACSFVFKHLFHGFLLRGHELIPVGLALICATIVREYVRRRTSHSQKSDRSERIFRRGIFARSW